MIPPGATHLDEATLAGLTRLGVEAKVRRKQQLRPVPGAGALLILDCLVALCLLCGVLVASNLAVMPSGVDEFLAVRVTLKNLLLMVVVMSGWALALRAGGLYTTPSGGRADRETWRIMVASLACAGIAGVFPATGGAGALGFGDLVTFWLALGLVLNAQHAAWHAIAQRRRTLTRRRVVIVGTGPLAHRMLDTLRTDTDVSYEIAGFVDTVTAVPASGYIARNTLATLDSLEAVLMRDAVDEVLIALPTKSRYQEIHQTLLTCERVGVSAKYRADLFETEVAWPTYDPDAGPMVTMRVTQNDYRLAIKRLLDLALAGSALVLLAPLLALAALAIKLESPGPVFYVQERYGRGRHRFRMFKFRTMVANADRLQTELETRNEADGPVFKIVDDPRITRLGRLLRRTSVDELPQIFNVLRGDMSLVGPRPLPVRDVERFTDAADMRRFSVRPGLTCLWQISGRSNLSFNDWMRLDLSYIDGWSLELDLLILARTLPAVLRGTGAH